MNFLGKLIGLIVGIVFFHNLLAIAICFGLGHIWDRSVGSLHVRVQAAPLSFIAPLFGLAGAIAKSDGRVSEQEIAATEQLMARMGLSSELRAAAIAQFNAGKQPGYVTGNAIAQLRIWCAGRRDRAIPAHRSAARYRLRRRAARAGQTRARAPVVHVARPGRASSLPRWPR